jgi:hypothetical protein
MQLVADRKQQAILCARRYSPYRPQAENDETVYPIYAPVSSSRSLFNRDRPTAP